VLFPVGMQIVQKGLAQFVARAAWAPANIPIALLVLPPGVWNLRKDRQRKGHYQELYLVSPKCCVACEATEQSRHVSREIMLI